MVTLTMATSQLIMPSLIWMRMPVLLFKYFFMAAHVVRSGGKEKMCYLNGYYGDHGHLVGQLQSSKIPWTSQPYVKCNTMISLESSRLAMRTFILEPKRSLLYLADIQYEPEYNWQMLITMLCTQDWTMAGDSSLVFWLLTYSQIPATPYVTNPWFYPHADCPLPVQLCCTHSGIISTSQSAMPNHEMLIINQ